MFTSAAGYELIVDAYECAAERLATPTHIREVMTALIDDLQLHPVAEPVWHRFGEPGGISGAILLAESHLTVHTFPERRYAAFNVYHCGRQLEWPWHHRLRELLGCERVSVRTVARGHERLCTADAS